LLSNHQEFKGLRKIHTKTLALLISAAFAGACSSMSVTKLVSEAQQKRIEIPATYETVTRTEKVVDENMEWPQVMCEVNMTRDNVRALQQALADKGYYKSRIDGIIGSITLNAARAYAVANSLPVGSNYIPMEVASKLGLDI